MKPLFTEYTPAERARMFEGKAASPLLPYRYKAKGLGDDLPASTGSLSVSGAQQKLGVCLENGLLRIGLNAKFAAKEINRALTALPELLLQLQKSHLSQKAQRVFRYHIRQRFLSLK